jgi:hypothetical protein
MGIDRQLPNKRRSYFAERDRRFRVIVTDDGMLDGYG